MPKRKNTKSRHSVQMKAILKERIKIEHVNNRIHRSFRRLDRLYEKTKNIFRAYIELALSGLILEKF